MTGIQVTGDMPWGMHVCVFYQTAEDSLDTCAAYFKAGLESNELCIWAISPPITTEDAQHALRRGITNFERHLAAGRIELLLGQEWYLEEDKFDLQGITGGWEEKLAGALKRGYEGLLVSGNAFWLESAHWKEFCEYEQELDRSLAEKKCLSCAPIRWERVPRAHQFTISRRSGDWEFLETPELKQAKQEIEKLTGALDILSKRFRGDDLLTPRERVVLAQIVRGASSKEAARSLGIGPRTVEFHRANPKRKLGAKNTADLVRRVLGP